MDEKMEEVIREYPVHVTGKRRIRGATLLETKEGLFSLGSYRDSLGKLEFEERVKEQLIRSGYSHVDKGVKNIRDEWLTRDSYGNRYLLKCWYMGRECNLRDGEDIYRAAAHLGKLHNHLILPDAFWLSPEEMEETEESENKTSRREGEEADGLLQDKNIVQTLSRHTREMKRVYNYVRNKKKRNDMEISILSQFKYYYEQACQAQEQLAEVDCVRMQQEAVEQGKVCHGSYNYHNIIFLDKNNIATTNFERCGMGLQIFDLYDFLRKIMEKNNWEKKQGIRAIEAYTKNHELTLEERQILYIHMLFPEKFWKQMNFYYNGKKSWMSMKNYDKLKKIQDQENARRKFLKELKGVLF